MLQVMYGILLVLVTVQVSAFATSLYLHRCLAHRALYMHPVMTFLFRLQLWLTTGIVAKEWVAVHRKHHSHTDVEGDPHSPVLKGLWPILIGNVYFYVREARKPETVARYARDVGNGWLDRWFFRWGTVGLALGVLLFVLLLGPIWGIAAFLAQVGLYIFLNAVINGAAHAIGYQTFENTATNLPLVALVTAGEGLHNNHHAYPTSARFSLRRGEADPGWGIIRVLGWLHLARPLHPAPVFERADIPAR